MNRDELVKAFVMLSEHGVPADIQEMLMNGHPSRGTRPGALEAVLNSVQADETERCRRIVERARFDEIDRDWRSILHRIKSHTPAESD